MTILGWSLIGMLTAYQWILISRAVLSWVQALVPHWKPKGLLLILAEFAFTFTDPPLKFLRKFIKPLRLGNIGLDMAFLVLFMLVMLCFYVVQLVCFG